MYLLLCTGLDLWCPTHSVPPSRVRVCLFAECHLPQPIAGPSHHQPAGWLAWQTDVQNMDPPAVGALPWCLAVVPPVPHIGWQALSFVVLAVVVLTNALIHIVEENKAEQVRVRQSTQHNQHTLKHTLKHAQCTQHQAALVARATKKGRSPPPHTPHRMIYSLTRSFTRGRAG